MQVNLYDFDKTIYDGDSTIDFYLFCLKKKLSIIQFLPLFIIFALLYKIKLKTKTEMKEKFYLFLTKIDNIDELTKEFWLQNKHKIKKFYLDKKHDKDIIISASPKFLLEPICKELKVKKLIASNVDKKTGKYDGKNCHGEEKVKRLNQEYKDLIINEAYSDNYSDLPILKLGKESYLVTKEKLKLLDEKELEKIKNHKQTKLNNLVNLIFILSVPFMTLLLCGDYELSYLKYLIPLSFICGIFINIKINFNKISKKFNIKYFILSLLFAIYTINLVSTYSITGIIWTSNILRKLFNLEVANQLIKTFICILAIPSTTYIVYYINSFIIPFIKKEYHNLTKAEKYFILSITILGLLFTAILYTKTNAFYYPMYHNEIYGNTDVIYTTDSGMINRINVYAQIGAHENDIRQPLFGLFSLPFSVTATFISSFVDFIPNSYYIIFNTIQIMLLAISIILIAKMLGLKKENKILFLCLIMSSFSTILFSFVNEQYIIGLFYLILTLYIWFFYKKEVNYCYIGAVGTLITSGIIFPVITGTKIKNLKKWLINILKCFICFVVISIITGQILMIFTVLEKFEYLMGFSGKELTFINKLTQFLYFVKSIFIAPKGQFITKNMYLCYRLIDVDFISVLGILIILACIVSLILNRKNKFAKISFLWIIFSFIILCLLGWGTQENGLILYSLYFFWSYISLISLLINKIKNRKLKILIYITLISIMLIFNIQEFLRILHFCFQNYYNVFR